MILTLANYIYYNIYIHPMMDSYLVADGEFLIVEECREAAKWWLLNNPTSCMGLIAKRNFNFFYI